METAIEVKKISKVFTINHEREQYRLLRDEIMNIAKKPIRWLWGHREKKEHFLALKDVTFSVNHGEVMGIIGRNGAGKSTLLKIISRVTLPSSGEVMINGRVNSLLEVGTGFHPELTGRENIYLNGAILGMNRKEIKNKFNDIVAFAGIEKFLDTPLKRYSTGMSVRLAFAVAAHIESEILLVDEVLAVGDAEFQKKCIGKMEEARNTSGRTILFVSHNIDMMRKLCDRCILLDNGMIKMIGDTDEVVSAYLNTKITEKAEIEFDQEDSDSDKPIVVKKIAIKAKNNGLKAAFDVSDSILIEIIVEVNQEETKLTPTIYLKNSFGECIFCTSDQTSKLSNDAQHARGIYVKQCIIPGNLLAPGSYYIDAEIVNFKMEKRYCFKNNALMLHVVENFDNIQKITRGYRNGGFIPGYIRPILEWRSQKI